MTSALFAMVYAGETILPHQVVSERFREGLDEHSEDDVE